MNFIRDIEATYWGDMSYKYVGKHGCDVALRMGYKNAPMKMLMVMPIILKMG